jgi:DHA1 family tetracycline resistance protein-like MFS transporter
MPILPFYAEEFGASATQLGAILSVYAAAQFVCAPLWGRLSDRVGRRPVMLVTIAGTALSLLALGLAPSLAWVAAARLLGGAFAANISVATAYVADVTDESERTRWMGMIGASVGVGFVLGPAIGGALAPLGEHVPLLAAAGLAAANLVHAALSLREPERHAESGLETVRGAVLRDPRVRLLCLTNFAFAAAVTQLETVFAYFMLHRFDYDASRVAAILVGMAVVMGGIQGGGMKALSARFEERTLVVSGCALLGAAFLWIPAAPSVGILLLPLLIASVGRAVAQPSLMSLASLSADSSQRGAVMGSFQASASLARVVGPIAGGWLYDREMGAPFVLAAVLLAGLVVAGRALPARASAAA